MSGSGSATPPLSHTHNLWIMDNVLCRQVNGNFGWVGQTAPVLADYMGDPAPPDSRFVGNVFYAPKSDKVYSLPPHNHTSTAPFTYLLSFA
jgi:hypothetical protein